MIDGADGIADALRLAADVYDIVELRAERAAALAAGDEAAVARLDARIAAAVRAHPEADRQAGLGRARALVPLARRARAAGARHAVVAHPGVPRARLPVRLVGAAGDCRSRRGNDPGDVPLARRGRRTWS